MKRTSDRVFGLIALALAALIIWRATLIQESFIQDPLGPKAFPIVVAIIMALSALTILFLPDEEPAWPGLPRLVEIAVAAGVMIAYAQMLPVAGFVAATAVAAAYLSWRLGATPLSSVIAGLVISIGIYVIFHWVLGLSLARGPWGF